MSEVFDPEKVERTTLRRDMVRDTAPFDPGDEIVHAADYDKLLALYREATHANKLMARTISDLLNGEK